MPLTHTAVEAARPRDKDYTLTDADGLALFVPTRGSKIWQFRFSWARIQRRMSLGAYPQISLKEARQRRDEARALIAKGIDPRKHRRQERQAAERAAGKTFEAVYERWRDFKALSLEMGRQSTLSQIKRIFAKDVLPRLGGMPVFEVTRADLLEILRKIEHRGALSTAEKCRTWFNQMLRYTIVEIGGIETNPAADLDGLTGQRESSTTCSVPWASSPPSAFLRAVQSAYCCTRAATTRKPARRRLPLRT